MLNKLEGFAPVYIINLSKRVDRRNAILREFLEYGVSDYTFIEGIDPTKENVFEMITVTRLSKPSEIACTLSHIKAIKYWLENSDTEQAIIVEDDLSFDTVPYWDFTWQEFLDSLDFEYDALQLSIFNIPENLNFKLHKRHWGDASAAIYVIKRDYAEKLLREMTELIISEGFLFATGNVYSAAMFTHNKESIQESNITPENVPGQIVFRETVLDYWKNRYTSITQTDQAGETMAEDELDPDLFDEDFDLEDEDLDLEDIDWEDDYDFGDEEDPELQQAAAQHKH